MPCGVDALVLVSVPAAVRVGAQVDRVETAEDLEFAMDGLALCRTRLVKLGPRTATKIVRAAARAGAPERGIAVLADSLRYRLFPEPRSFHWIATHVGLQGNAELVQAAYDAMATAEVALNRRGAGQFIKAFVDAGSLEGALSVYDAAMYVRVSVFLPCVCVSTRRGVCRDRAGRGYVAWPGVGSGVDHLPCSCVLSNTRATASVRLRFL